MPTSFSLPLIFLLLLLLLLLIHSQAASRADHKRLADNVVNFDRSLTDHKHADARHKNHDKIKKPRSIFHHHQQQQHHHPNDLNQPIASHQDIFNQFASNNEHQSASTKHSCQSIRSTDNLYNELWLKSFQTFNQHGGKKQSKLHSRRRRHQHKMLKKFYEKYTEAYGVLVLSPKSVPDSAVKRACYVLRFLLADRADVRKAFQSKGGRLVVLGKNNYIADLPEYKLYMQQQKQNPQQQRVKQILKRIKNVPSNNIVAVTTTTEENLLCYKNFSHFVAEVNFVEDVLNNKQPDHNNNKQLDNNNNNNNTELASQLSPLNNNNSYKVIDEHHTRVKNGLDPNSNKIVCPHHHHHNHHNHRSKHHNHQEAPHNSLPCTMPKRKHMSRDDITLKSLAIGILNIAVSHTNPSLIDRLEKAYKHALLTGLWLNTDAESDVQSYFGEGVQSYYNANAYARPANGFNNEVNTRVKLKSHDPELYAIVHEVFPCANNYVKRCGSRGNEARLLFEKDCPVHRWKER